MKRVLVLMDEIAEKLLGRKTSAEESVLGKDTELGVAFLGASPVWILGSTPGVTLFGGGLGKGESPDLERLAEDAQADDEGTR